MSNTNNTKRLMSNKDIVIIIIAAILMTAAAFIQYFYMRNSIVAAATQSAKSDLSISCQQIETEVTSIETAVNTMGFAVLQNTDMPEMMYDITYRVLKENPIIQSCAVAFSKGYYSPQKDSLFAPCTFRVGERYNRRLLIGYIDEPWYSNPASDHKSQWSEPYVEKGGSSKLLVTYSYPVTDRQGRLIAVLAANIPVESLTKAIDGVEGYPHSYATLISKNGHHILNTRENVSENDALVLSSEVGKVGWNLTTICPNKDIDAKTRATRLIVLLMHTVALLLLIVIVVRSLVGLRRLQRTEQEVRRMGSELEQAGDVQDAMQPSESGDLPHNDKVHVVARMVNAREMGGDFYDCFIDKQRLFYCIGDVSGLGAPAALLMAMVRSAFRVSAQHQENPAQIISEVNRLICKMNDDKTTIKLFGGIIDLTTGTMQFCNAGMHAPKLLTAAGISELEVISNNRIGVNKDTPYQEQQTILEKMSTLFLYTDGLTEAENHRKEQWGQKRLNIQLASIRRMNPDRLLSQIEKSITSYTEGINLPDDITMLTIQYFG